MSPVQKQMDQQHDNKHQSRPFVNFSKKMPEYNREPAFAAAAPGDKQPVDQARKAQYREQYKRNDIDYPELCCLIY